MYTMSLTVYVMYSFYSVFNCVHKSNEFMGADYMYC